MAVVDCWVEVGKDEVGVVGKPADQEQRHNAHHHFHNLKYEDIVLGKPADNEHKTSKSGIGCRIGCSTECQVSLDKMTAIRRTRHKTNILRKHKPSFSI